MKIKPLKLAISFILVIMISCDVPVTVVTNIVHHDGSVTRKIEMRNLVNKFGISDIQVPFDSTWIVKDSLEISEKGDTTWVKRAEKLYKNINEINSDYLADSGANKEISRRVEFRKTFKWFNTEYRFAEIIDRKMSHGYPVSDFLNQEELQWFYSPEDVNEEKRNGPDSIRFKALDDTVEMKTDKWAFRNLVSEWIYEFTKLTEGKADNDMTLESLKAREEEFTKIIEENEEKFDSLWSNGFLLREFIGESNALKYGTEADSAGTIASEHFWISFSDYSVRIILPGKLIGTNGFMDSTKILLWPVKSNYFLTQPYEMWAESKVPNKWTWIVSGIFLLFVLAGIIFRVIKKG